MVGRRSSSTAPRTTGRRAARRPPIEALQTNAFGVQGARAGSAAPATPCSCTTAPISCSMERRRPYTEDDRPNPRSVYAASKMLGEWFAEDAPRAYVLRVESLFGRVCRRDRRKGQCGHDCRRGPRGFPARVFEDRTVSPTYVPDAARATRALLERGAPAGVYHCVNSGHCTWLEFGQEVARRLGVEPRFEVLRQSELKLPAERPQYCALSNDKLAAAGVTMPTWQDALARYLEDLARTPRPRWRLPACQSPGMRSGRAIRCRPHERGPGYRIAPDQKSANASSGGCSLARMPLPESRMSSNRSCGRRRRVGATNASSARRSSS